jgi:hypothetical protein
LALAGGKKMTKAITGETVFALSGLGGNNAHGAGFLAAAQDAAGRGDDHPALFPNLKMITCTSGTIASVAAYLQGQDLRAMVQAGIDAVDRATWLPREHWADPVRLALITGWVGVPGIFGPYAQALAQHVLTQTMAVAAGTRPPLPPTPEEWVNTVLSARMFIPQRPDADFEHWAEVFNHTHVGIAFNSFDPSAGEECLYVNEPGMGLIKQHHDPDARYHGKHKRSTYQPIDASAIKKALWLFWYGFDQPRQHVDGAYARSIILNEATFADTIYAVKPVNHRWIGPLPQNALEVLDMQTELWMGTSYRLQRYQIDLINRLLAEDRLRDAKETGERAEASAEHARISPSKQDRHLKDYHPVRVVPIEIQMQRGFFTYFVEDIEVFDAAYQQARELLSC